MPCLVVWAPAMITVIGAVQFGSVISSAASDPHMRHPMPGAVSGVLPHVARSTPNWVMLHPSSATFWDLMDRWDVSDDQAMELVGYEGKLPRPIGDLVSGSRPSRPVLWRTCWRSIAPSPPLVWTLRGYTNGPESDRDLRWT